MINRKFAYISFCCVLSALILCRERSCPATVLTFETNGSVALADTNFTDAVIYGHRVENVTQDGYQYGLAHGVTPNLVAQYGTNLPLGSQFFGAGPDYGDLTNVAFAYPQGGDFVWEMSLVADIGHHVQLHGFDLAAFGVSNQTNVTIQVLNGDNDELFTTPGEIAITYGGHTNFYFDMPLQARIIKIRVTEMLNAGYLGLDNVAFGQVSVPEPKTIVLFTIALVIFWRFGTDKNPSQRPMPV